MTIDTWIAIKSIKDLPEYGKPVLVLQEPNNIFIAYRGRVLQAVFVEWFIKSQTGFSYCGYQFSHWQDLPSLPKE